MYSSRLTSFELFIFEENTGKYKIHKILQFHVGTILCLQNFTFQAHRKKKASVHLHMTRNSPCNGIPQEKYTLCLKEFAFHVLLLN